MTYITDFLQGDNASTAVVPAIKAALESDKVLCFPQGEYHFYMEGCSQKYCYFSNNDEGLKTVAMLLTGIDDFTIRGENAKLIFHGRLSPLCAFNCRNLKIEGLTIDFEDSFVSDADLVKRENGVAWFRFSGKYQVRDGEMIFADDVYNNMNKRLGFYSYDLEKGELVHNAKSITVPNKAVQFCDGLVGVEDRFADVTTDAFAVKHEARLCPGIVCDNCENIEIRNVTIHHAAGMGFLIQNSENALLDSVAVLPSFRRASASDDALHITDCRGKIKIANCKFSGTLDDSINVHGVFRKLKSRIPGGKMYYLEAGHFQQQGVFNVHAGDTMQLFDRKDGKPYAKIKITKVTPVNKAFVIVDFDESELPAKFVQGDPVMIMETMADLEVVNTECKPLLGRGVLASGMNSVKISDCHFHSSGAGVFISGDFSFWYESGPVNVAEIENNFFDNCNYYAHGATREPLAVFPELATLAGGYFYHGTIKVKNNRFRSASRPLVSMMSVENAVVENNVFTLDETYPFAPGSDSGYFFTDTASPAAAFLHCGRICDENNTNFRK